MRNASNPYGRDWPITEDMKEAWLGVLQDNVVEAKKALSVPQKHQLKIAKDTLKMSDAGAKVMGGMSKDEAKKFLKSIGYCDAEISKLES